MNFVGYFSKSFWVFYGCFRWVLFYQIGGFLVGLCKGLSLLNSGELGVTITIEDPVEYLYHFQK